MDNLINSNRNFLKDYLRLEYDFGKTDQNQGVPPPPVQKQVRSDQRIISLPTPGESSGKIQNIGLVDAITKRKSHRHYIEKPLLMDELSFLLWVTQGIRGKADNGHAYRVVPSAGCRHSFETYIAVINVSGLKEGIYRYLPIGHSIVLEKEMRHLSFELTKATLGQSFTGTSAATFIWTCIPYRMEWRYGLAAHRVIAFDIGHVCQNLYLSVEAISSGTCATGAYNQKAMDELIGVDSEDEFTIYLAPVGKIK